ncbi:MAG: SprT family zinc-dependent metalloprotease [Spirochaetia bacterium]
MAGHKNTDQETLQLSLNGEKLQILVKRRSRQKYIRLRISGRGEVLVSAPKKTSRTEIRRAVDSKSTWISGCLKRVLQGLEEADPLKQVFYSGERYSVRIIYGNKDRFSVALSEEKKILTVKVPQNYAEAEETLYREAVEGAIARTLKRKASEKLRRTAAKISSELGLSFKRVYIRNQKTRWGSSSSLGNISLNWRLIMAPEEVQRYLIIHELAHQRQLNHSINFWEEVQRYCPDFRSHEAWLKQHRTLIALFR